MCVAVGDFSNSSGVFTAMAERYDGVSWTLENIPIPPSAQGRPSELNDVACPSVSDCLAVGAYTHNGLQISILLEHFNGTSWSIQSVPVPPHTFHGAQLEGITCLSATDCIAVGYYTHTGHVRRPMVEQYNGTRWTVQRVPWPANGDAELIKVSCASSRMCVAVGQRMPKPGTRSTGIALAERYNGTRWTIDAVPPGPPSQENLLHGISCPTPRMCIAVGTEFHFFGYRQIIEQFNGRRWSLVRPGFAQHQSVVLVGVACQSARGCVAVGSNFLPNVTTVSAVAEDFNGSSWSPAVNPASAGAQLAGIFCPLSGSCLAAGNISGPPRQTLVETGS